MPPASRRPLLLLALLAAVVVLGLNDLWPGSAVAVPAGAPVPLPPRASDSMTAAQRRALARQDSSDRAHLEHLLEGWLGTDHWVVTAPTDSSVALIEAGLADSSAAELMRAFVTIPTLRDSAGQIELVGDSPAGRTILVGNVDSLVRAGARERLRGCVTSLVLPVRRTPGVQGGAMGFVPGMVRAVPPSDTVGTQCRADAMRLFAALPDSTLYPEVLDSLRAATWSQPRITLWRDGEGDVLVAKRRRASMAGGYEHYVQEQLVIAERPAGTDRPFATVRPHHAAYDTDETSSMWVERAVRIGPAGRFALVLGYEGKEGGAGGLLVRVGTRWSEAVQWSWGC